MSYKIFQCSGCAYQFNEAVGDEYEGYPPGTLFDSLSVNFTCPDCAVCNKQDFFAIEDNQNSDAED